MDPNESIKTSAFIIYNGILGKRVKKNKEKLEL